jgi:hypothetical protein
VIVVDREWGPSTEAAAADLGWLKPWKHIEKLPEKPQAPAVLHDEAELVVCVARELLMTRGSAVARRQPCLPQS